ncbi:MAG: SpoIIE family protein phosphatase [Deltaproteobacteria bacterium]|nr:SpoIIE family protein phosphatase [Deltaproteobacteria bacterium]
MKTAVPFTVSSPDHIAQVFSDALLKLKEKKPQIFFSKQTVSDMKTAFVEAVANAVRHAREIETQQHVGGSLYFDDDDQSAGFDVVDHGPGFDIEAISIPDLSAYQDSGRGIFIMRQLGDTVSYKKNKNENVLTFRRKLIANEGNRGLDLLYELSEAIIQRATLDEVYQIILDRALELFHVERASILIYDEEQGALKMVASRGIAPEVRKATQVRPGDGVSGYVFKHGRPLLIENIDQNKRGIEKKVHYKTGSFISAPMICSPLRIDERSIGVINLTDRLDGKKFSKKDLMLLSTIANQAMACLYIRGLVDQASRAEHLRQEMEQVRLIQNSYLPRRPPIIRDYDIAGRCEMAQSVGGDYFDYILKGDDLYLVVADVSGHNTSSAVTMVNFRSQLKAFVSLESDPANILNKLNESLFMDLERHEQFVSCLLVRLHTKTGKFVAANAGHYPLLNFSGLLAEAQSGLVLGVDIKEKYQNTQGSIEQGDGILLFTDGVVESMDQSGTVFGLERLKKTLSEKKEEGSTPIVDHIIASVSEFRKTEKHLDDITVVSLKRT